MFSRLDFIFPFTSGIAGCFQAWISYFRLLNTEFQHPLEGQSSRLRELYEKALEMYMEGKREESRGLFSHIEISFCVSK